MPKFQIPKTGPERVFSQLNFAIRHSSFVILWVLGCLGIWVLPSSAQTFEQLRQTISASPATQEEATILKLLDMGLEEGKPTQAITEAQKWLRQSIPEDNMLLYKAGLAAEFSGDWKSAAALYQRYLKKADLQSLEADKAVYRVYSILIENLKDTSGAYSFSRTDGQRLLVCPRARQFDKWFLDEAVKRKDAEAVAKRLHACISAGLPGELLEIHYYDYFRWLLQQVEGYIDRGGFADFTKEFQDAGKELAKVLLFDRELGLRLDWAISIKAYNLAKIADKDVAPPLNEAAALLKEFPQLAQYVQSGWAGGGNGQYYRGDPKKYWPHRIEEKMALIVEATSRLTPLQMTSLLQSWEPRFYSDNTVRPHLVKVVREFLLANPALINSRIGFPLLEKEWHQYTYEEARELAPLLSNCPQRDASLIRAMVAAGEQKDFDKAMEAMLGPEIWRMPMRMDMHRIDGYNLGKYCNNTEKAKVDEWAKRVTEANARVKAEEINENDPADQRLATFRTFWNDYLSAEPKIPGVYERLYRLLLFTPEAIPELLQNPRPEAQILAQNALINGTARPDKSWSELESTVRVNVSSYSPGILFLAKRHRSLEELKRRYPLKDVPHPLEPALRKSVEDGIQNNQLEAWAFIAWINMQHPDNNVEQVELMKKILVSPVWKTLPSEAQYAAREWFKKSAMTRVQQEWLDAADPNLACKDLFTLSRESDLETTLQALDSAIKAIRKSPSKTEMLGLEKLAEVPASVFADPQVVERIYQITDDQLGYGEQGAFIKRVFSLVTKNRDPIQLQRTAGYLWPYIAGVEPRQMFEPMKKLTIAMIEEHPEAGYTLAMGGLKALTSARNSYGFSPEKHVPEMKPLVGQAAVQLGLVVIPVRPNHPAYPIYLSQGEWIKGNEDSAGNLLDENSEQLMQVYRNLSQPYLLWALQRTIYSRDEQMQETLVKALLEWAAEDGSPFTLQEKIRIEIAYGDIAMQRGQIREALEIFSRTRKNKSYQETLEVHDATLRQARAQRISKNFDGALQTLTDLEFQRIPEIWSQTRFARAEVYFDMEEFDDAAEDIDSILAREPNHADAKIMLGKVQLKREKLMEATEVELGSAMAQKSLVPGEKLKVTLNDPTLDVSGAGSEIEVVVWTTSEDREQFFLRRFGDEKTKFRGEVMTALGKPSPNDGILQVIGDDKIFYAYSQRFREKMNGLEEKQGGPITVASDALLMASARKLLTEAEQRVADMEQMLKQVEGNKLAAQKKMAARKVDSEARLEDGLDFETNLQSIAKPGNPIHVRVIDPDRSRTDGIDELMVSVASSSGDSVDRITLKETGTHTGWFEGSVPTSQAQAMAFGNTSEAGRNPNMVISPKQDYPAWRPESVKGQHPVFTVDLNDNVDLGKLNITASETGAKLTRFALQTGMNQEEMNTVAIFPKDQLTLEKPWHPSVTIMNDTDQFHARHDRTVYDFQDITRHMEWGWMSQRYAAGISENVSGPSQAMDPAIHGKVKWLRHERHHNAHVIYRFRGYFYEPENTTRRFKVQLGKFQIPENTHPSVAHPPEFLLAVDGRILTDKEKKDQLEGSINLRPGLHRFEIWATGWDNTIGFGRSIKLFSNLEDPEQLTECPDSFFDPASFPPGILTHRNSKTHITANADETVFSVDFQPNSKARLIRLLIIGNEGSVPAINKISLTDADGGQVLPVKEDYAGLLKNDTLEILADDRISIRYVDDRFVTKSKEKQERFLDVRFTNARVEFADMEPRWDGRKNAMVPFYEQLLRFPYGEELTLAIHDGDMDSTVEPDSVKVHIAVGKSEAREYTASETGDSTGIFKLVLAPVAAAEDSKAGSPNTLVIPEGETIYATYRDEETTQPGVAADRIATIKHAAVRKPIFRIAHPETIEYNEEYDKWMVESQLRSAEQKPENGFQFILGQHAFFEVEVPHLALRKSSTLQLFAQTDAGRKAAGAATADGFQISVPGTIEITGNLLGKGIDLRGNDPGILETRRKLSRNYSGGNPWSSPENKDMSTFRFSVPILPGILPEYGYLSSDEKKVIEEEREKSRFAGMENEELHGLVAKPGESVHIGLPYKDADGNEKWITTSAKVISHPTFKILDSDYRKVVTTAYAGETLHLYVSDMGADLTDAPDEVTLLLQAKSGAKGRVTLHETEPHSGIFTGGYFLSYAQLSGDLPDSYDIKRQGFPVVYGDTVAARYYDPYGLKTPVRFVTISKGANGTIEPFSKKYDDPEVAVRTQFSLAEAYLEMAKRHRKLGENELAQQEFASAKQLLTGSIDQFRDPNTRSHAEYLLGNLTLEEALAAPDEETRETRFRAALARFMNVTGTYPDTLHASKAQFKVATIYEALREPDIAAQEYVKLAYKHPDSEFLATAMARLGSHFLRKAASYEAQAKPLLEQGEAGNNDAAFEGAAMQKMAVREYLKTAKIFERLLERFPDNSLAGEAGLRSGQAYMRAGSTNEALNAFLTVTKDENFDKEVRSASMYWAGMCYQNLRNQMAAYSIYKRLTYDFPETDWAKYARGQLSEPGMLNLEKNLEIERLQAEIQK